MFITIVPTHIDIEKYIKNIFLLLIYFPINRMDIPFIAFCSYLRKIEEGMKEWIFYDAYTHHRSTNLSTSFQSPLASLFSSSLWFFFGAFMAAVLWYWSIWVLLCVGLVSQLNNWLDVATFLINVMFGGIDYSIKFFVGIYRLDF